MSISSTFITKHINRIKKEVKEEEKAKTGDADATESEPSGAEGDSFLQFEILQII